MLIFEIKERSFLIDDTRVTITGLLLNGVQVLGVTGELPAARVRAAVRRHRTIVTAGKRRESVG